MCGRVACTLAPQYLIQETNADWCELDDTSSYQTYNAGPTSDLPVMVANCQLSTAPMLKLMKWGLIPSYSKTGMMENSTFNARSETITSKSMFKRLLKQRRCVALVDGFYEWQNNGACKQPHFVSSQNSDILYMAGLFDCWDSKLDGKKIFSFTVLTMESTNDLSWLHNRKPVILDSEEKIQSWLALESEFDFNKFLKLLQDSKPLKITKVSSLVNSVKNNSPDCKKPFAQVQHESISKFLAPQSKSPQTSTIKTEPKQTQKTKTKIIKQKQPTLNSLWQQ